MMGLSGAPAEATSWAGGFNSRVHDPSTEELTATFTVTFDDQGMYDAFRDQNSGPNTLWTFGDSGTATLSYRRRRRDSAQ